MGLFKVLGDVASMPIRIGVDIVKIPGKILNIEDDFFENTTKCIEKIEEDLDE